MPKGRKPYVVPRKGSPSRRTPSDSSSRRQGGREFKGSDSLHKSSGQILSEKRAMRRMPGPFAEDTPGYNFLAQGNRRVGNNLIGQIKRGQVLKRKGTR